MKLFTRIKDEVQKKHILTNERDLQNFCDHLRSMYPQLHDASKDDKLIHFVSIPFVPPAVWLKKFHFNFEII